MGKNNSIATVAKLLGKIVAFVIVVALAQTIIEDKVEGTRYDYVDREYEVGETAEGPEYTVIVKGATPFTGDASTFKVKNGEKLVDVEIQIKNNKASDENMDEGGYFFNFSTLDYSSCTYYGKGYNEVDIREIGEVTDNLYLPAGRSKTVHYIIGVPEIAERITVQYSEYNAKGGIDNTINVNL